MSAPIKISDVTVGDYTFHINESGPADGKPIIWLHGSGPGATASSNWEWLLGEFGDTYHNIAPDIIGFGDSTHPNPPPEGMAAFAELRVATLLSLFDELGFDKVTLVGNSMGGMISLEIVRQVPERVEKLILMGSAGGQGGAPKPGLFKMISFYENPTAESMAEILRYFLHDPDSFDGNLQQIAETRLKRAMRPEVERSHRATFNFAAGGPIGLTTEDLEQITQPTLLVHGDDDKIVPIESSQFMADHIPNSRFEIFKDTGHWLQIEQGPRFAKIVRAFLEEDAK